MSMERVIMGLEAGMSYSGLEARMGYNEQEKE